MVGDFTFGRLNSAASLAATRQKRGHHRIEIRPNWCSLAKKEKDDERALFSLY